MFDTTLFLQYIDEYENIVIAGHVYPDGDAVGACFAMALFAASRGKKPVVLLGSYAPQYDCLRGQEFLWQGDWADAPCDLFIALDCGGKDRLGTAQTVFDRAEMTVNIDHHASNDGFAMLNCVDIRKSSASELLYTLLRDMAPLDAEMAAALFAGIVFDTGGFRHSSATADTFAATAALLQQGIDAPTLQRKVLYTHTLPATRIFSTALAKAHFSAVAPIVCTAVTHTDMEAAGAKPHDLEGIVDYLLDIEGASVSIFVSERAENMCKISLRSRILDVNAIASQFGGGGHKKAAGASIAGTAAEALAQIVAACEEGWRNINA